MRILTVLICCLIISACAGPGTRKAGGGAGARNDSGAQYLEVIPMSATIASEDSELTARDGESDLGEPSPFEHACELPYAKPGPERDIDLDCSETGNHRPGPVADEYRAKNNLCADGPITRLSLNDFSRLQAATNANDIPNGHSSVVIDDRSVLTQLISAKGNRIGEGSLVQVFGYIREVPKTYDSNTSSGEGVNCKRGGPLNNDFHANLVRSRDDGPCAGIVVEFIPHFRPEIWQSKVIRALIGGPKVRVTGALFYDAKHRIDECPAAGQPKRFSLWEIHPIYRFEVCVNDDDSKCRISNDADWTSLERLLN